MSPLFYAVGAGGHSQMTVQRYNLFFKCANKNAKCGRFLCKFQGEGPLPSPFITYTNPCSIAKAPSHKYYTNPCSTMAFATFMKPAMLAPLT